MNLIVIMLSERSWALNIQMTPLILILEQVTLTDGDIRILNTPER